MAKAAKSERQNGHLAALAPLAVQCGYLFVWLNRPLNWWSIGDVGMIFLEMREEDLR